MKKFIVIGLGNFGLNLSKSLMKNGCEVLGIDTAKETVEHAKDFISHAIIGDASNKEVLESLMLKDFDGAIVSIGQEMALSILISLYLKEIGVPRIIVRAISEDHGKILRMIGVTDVIFPEKDEAFRLANKLTLKNAIDYLPLGEDYGIVEVSPPKSFIGKTLMELKITTRFNCQVIGIKYLHDNKKSLNMADLFSDIKIALSGNDIVPKNSVMIIIGKYSDIDKIQALEK